MCGVCTHVDEVCVPMYMQGEGRGRHLESSFVISTICFETKFLTEPECLPLAKLAGQ